MHRSLLLVFILVGCSSPQHGPPTPAESQGTVGDWIRGGALYDKWWVVADVPKPTTDHPLWDTRPDKETNKRRGATTWRCKECHAWDYQGAAGAYSSGSHHTGFPGVAVATSKDAQTLFTIIRDQHGYGNAGLQDPDVRDLVAFIQQGVTDVRRFIDDKKAIRGDASAGDTAYHTGHPNQPSCADCHGDKGLMAPDNENFDDYLGKVGRKNPWELIHKIRFGQPGTDMPASAKLWSLETVTNLGAYVQTLPQSP